MAMIVCKGIHKFYGKGESRVEALSGVDLEINKGELTLLMGPSGSGKTTLISILSAILTQDSGQCLINGLDINHLSNGERTRFRREHVGFVFQSFNLISTLAIEENVSIPLLLQGTLREEALSRSKDILKEFGLSDKIGRLPIELSGGQQQRVAIARAMIHNPELIVCDEPTSFLDLHTGLKIMGLLKELVQTKHINLVVVTHDPRIVPFADKIHRLEEGKIKNDVKR